jgi:hypothetical protein
MNFSDYLSIPACNWSSLKRMGVSPLHYRHHMDSPPTPPTDAMVIGSATHKAVLEPEDFGSEYAVWTGARRAGKEWDAFCAANAGKEILREQDVDRVQALALSVQRHPGCARYLDGPGVNELTIEWNDLPTGVACKGRADRVTDDGVLIDLKTTRDLTPRPFMAASCRLGYHAQLAFYADGLRASGYDVHKVVILAVESSAPYDCGVFVLGEDVLYAGRKEYRALLRRLAECRESGRWPGRYEEEQSLELPEWARPDIDGDEDGADYDLEDM